MNGNSLSWEGCVGIERRQGGVYTPLQRLGFSLKPLPTPSQGRESRSPLNENPLTIFPWLFLLRKDF